MNERINEICQVVEDLKRRNIFVALLVTKDKMSISYWNGREIKTGDVAGAKRHVRMLDECDRREYEWLEKRLGNGRSKGRATKPARCVARSGM